MKKKSFLKNTKPTKKYFWSMGESTNQPKKQMQQGVEKFVETIQFKYIWKKNEKQTNNTHRPINLKAKTVSVLNFDFDR